jgi:hypothetical protein
MYFALYVCCCLYPSCLVEDIIFCILVVLSSYVCGFVCIPIFFVVCMVGVSDFCGCLDVTAHQFIVCESQNSIFTY